MLLTVLEWQVFISENSSSRINPNEVNETIRLDRCEG